MKKFIFQFGAGLGPLSIVYPYISEIGKHSNCEMKYIGNLNLEKQLKNINISSLTESFIESDIRVGEFYNNWVCAEEFWERVGYCYCDKEWLFSKLDLYENLVRQYAPDWIITSLGLLSCIVARTTKTPLLSLVQACYHPNNLYETVRWWDETKYNKYPKLNLKNYINEYLMSRGVAPICKFEDIFLGTYTVTPGFPSTDPLKKENHNTIYTGTKSSESSFADIEKIPQKVECKNNIVVFCYTGKFNDNVGNSGEKLFFEVLKVASKFDYQFVVSVGNAKDLSKAKQIIEKEKLDNVFVFESISEKTIFNLSDIVIHHGGHGCCMAQIKYKTPGLIIPTHSEREYNAIMMKKNGLAEYLPINEVSEEKICLYIHELLNNTKYKESLNLLASTSKKYEKNFSYLIKELVK